MHVTGRWPIAHPLYESADGLGAGAPAPVEAPPVESESLSDHEASFSPEAQRAPAGDEPDDAPAGDTRRPDGTFKPRGERHRAASQAAGADDVAAINEHTKRVKDAEAKLGADIPRKPGESERVYNLRRRAEVLERYSSASPAAQPQTPKPTAPPAPTQRHPSQVPQRFPSDVEFFAMAGNESATFDDYIDARARWNYAVTRQAEREQDAAETRERTQADQIRAHNQRLTTRTTKYPDWDTVVTNDIVINGVTQHAILASDQSDDLQYFLGKHPQIAAELFNETLEYSSSAVAATKRYLESLVAGQRQPPPPRTAAGTTGAALALAHPPAPRPPTPVRTGAVSSSDDPPGDDASLAAHEKFYAPRAHRR